MNRWGLFGVIIAIGAVSLLAGWIFDRKKKREYEAAVAAADAADAAEARAKQA